MESLGSKKRREILAALSIAPLGVTELARVLGYTTPDMSLQLRRLRDDGLVVNDRHGKRHIHRVVVSRTSRAVEKRRPASGAPGSHADGDGRDQRDHHTNWVGSGATNQSSVALHGETLSVRTTSSGFHLELRWDLDAFLRVRLDPLRVRAMKRVT